MKKTIMITITSTLLLAFMMITPVKAQTDSKPIDSLKSVPVEVFAIFKKSCIGCHSDPGKIKPLEKLNFSKWDELSAEKQAEKAKAMCDEVTKGEMPPKKAREKYPEAIPTADELKTLCDWMQSMQIGEKITQ